jgi:hypothetical protein
MPKVVGKRMNPGFGSGSGSTTKKGKTLRARPRTPSGGGGSVQPSGYRGAPTLMKPPSVRGAKGDGPTGTPQSDSTSAF